MKKVFQIFIFGAVLTATAQEPVSAGRGSYAAYPPPYKARTDEHAGFNATKMLTRKVYADETAGRPLPTNDWWTDLLNNRFSGAMWSLPAMVKSSDEGITVAYPTRWNENGTEVKADSWVRVGAVGFAASEARAADWHDWDVIVDLPAAEGSGKIRATLAHGMPFTWFEFTDLRPQIVYSAAADTLRRVNNDVMVRVGSDLYGLYSGDGWLSVGLLRDEADFEDFMAYAPSVVRSTALEWNYNEETSELSTLWSVKAENLRTPGAEAPVIMGFLPHVYKHFTASDISFDNKTYLTPRGEMKPATSATNTFAYSYRFAGMLPYYAAPNDAGFDPEVMRGLMQTYANGGSFGDDTYWGGKGLTQMALNMTFAKETGETEIYVQSRGRLRAALEDWLTYSPGENTKFFAYYPRWGGMLGFDVSYDSDAFNDHHFHYGYFLYAAALLCLEDADFAAGYGEILTLLAKDYANWDRTDRRFPFLRTLDPWVGHSYAGGLGDHGNDNGNGQESSSEAMQGWGGVYLLGVALGNKEMRDAGIFGWLTESRATAEYWFDRDHIRPGAKHNYDYTRYSSPYNTNITSKGIGWWTWFSGDPLWMHSIQWMPVSPCLNYLSEDLEFVEWDYETMIGSTAYKWFDAEGDNAPLADQSVGNVVLCYMERHDPAGASAIFDEALRRNAPIARNADTGHISYFVIHSHLTHGDIDFTVSADIPTANAYRRKDGTMAYMVYNPSDADRRVTFRRGSETLRTVMAPPRRLTVFTSEAAAAAIEITSERGFTLPAGSRTELRGQVFDQYGAQTANSVSWSVGGTASIDADGVLTIADNAPKGSHLTVTATSGELIASVEITVNDYPRIVSAKIEGLTDFTEIGTTCTMSLHAVDQYGTESHPEIKWAVNGEETAGNTVTFSRAGLYTVSTVGLTPEQSRTITVFPPLPNVAKGGSATSSSEENAGTLTANGIDGDRSTRWGSQHSDDQWYMVDLGAQYRISSVSIDWEAAYAADYDIEVSADGKEWTTAAAQRGLSGAGTVRHTMCSTGRYVRVNCLRRGSAYGFSFYELEIGGIRADADPSTPIGLEVIAPQLLKEGTTTSLQTRAIRLDGAATEVDVTWSSEPDGEFDGNRFTPLTYGAHTLTATTGELTSQCVIMVEESVKLAGISVSPASLSLVSGESAHIDVEGSDQFGGIYPLGDGEPAVSITDADGQPVATATVFDTATGIFRTEQAGDFIIDFGGMARVDVSVRDINDANLALGRRATATSAENDGLTADKAVDGQLSTRWGSRFFDNQSLTVDLGSIYLLHYIKIFWNSPAYATDYTVELSRDGESFHTVTARRGWNGETDDVSFSPEYARYVRVTGLRRSTQYGTSIDELEVYGSEILSEIEITEAHKKTADALIDLQGRRVDGHPVPGIYLKGHRKTIIR